MIQSSHFSPTAENRHPGKSSTKSGTEKSLPARLLLLLLLLLLIHQGGCFMPSRTPAVSGQRRTRLPAPTLIKTITATIVEHLEQRFLLTTDSIK